MNRIALAAALIVAGISGQAMAAEQQPVDTTMLSLRESASASVVPDLLSTTVRAESRGSDAKTAQQQVNAAVARALAKAKDARGITATTGSYVTYQPPHEAGAPRQSEWVASQTMTLIGPEVSSVMELTGEYQKDGLMLVDVHGELSRALRTATQDRLVRDALARLQASVQVASEALSLHFVGWHQVKVEKGENAPPRTMLMRAVSAEAGVVPPSAAPGEQIVTVSAEGEAVLRP